MTDQEKRLIVEKRALGQSFVQIGRELGCSEDAARVAFNRIMRKKAKEQRIHIAADPESRPPRCRYCGKPFTRTTAGSKQVFCSKQCRYAWCNEKKRRRAHVLVCEHCGLEFVAFGNPHRRFCSRQCFAAGQKEVRHE